jgi:hypothetical protein
MAGLKLAGLKMVGLKMVGDDRLELPTLSV